MTPTPLNSMSFAYIECDIPEGQTLTEWRRDLEAARAAARPVRRRLRLFPRLRSVGWAS